LLLFYPRFNEIKIKTNFAIKNICSDRKRLNIILSNFITNAVKYHDFKRDPEIIISSEKNENGLLIKVIDNGPGIEPEHLEKLFDSYYRARQDSKGSGLGLSIAKESADIIGATLSIESQFGKSTTASLQLPTTALILNDPKPM
jgi:signal transduction histidine kinase